MNKRVEKEPFASKALFLIMPCPFLDAIPVENKLPGILSLL